MSLKDKLNEYDCLAKTKKIEELKETFQNKFDSEEGKYSPRQAKKITKSISKRYNIQINEVRPKCWTNRQEGLTSI